MSPTTAEQFPSRLGGTIAVVITWALFAIAPAPSAKAAPLGTFYTYTGNAYTFCSGTYCIGGPYALSASFVTTLMGAALDNLPLTDITSTITSFVFTDGSGLKVDQNTAGGSTSISIATDAGGNIVAWLAGGYANSANLQMQTNWHSTFGFIPGRDFSETTASFAGSYGYIDNQPGTWVMAAVPEPPGFVLLSVGLGIIGMLRIAKRHQIQAQRRQTQAFL
jgi:hypothetical protein